MDCARFQPLLSQLIDADLDDALALEVREHLIECAACAALERDLRQHGTAPTGLIRNGRCECCQCRREG